MQFNVNSISLIDWDDDAFASLVIPQARKDLLRSLIEANANLNDPGQGAKFDDVVRGKGQGVIITLFGPPGVGKTLSAEATSEYLHRPLYRIGGGDLDKGALGADEALATTCELAVRWKAVLLIDEVSFSQWS